MVSVQTFICLVYMALRERNELKCMLHAKKTGLFIGLTSAVGSIGWFTAMTLQTPAIVRTAGQIEFLFTLAITVFYFKEKVYPREFAGMVLIMTSVVLLLQ